MLPRKNITHIVKKLMGGPLIFTYYLENGEIVIDSGGIESSLSALNNNQKEKDMILFEVDLEDILAGNI